MGMPCAPGHSAADGGARRVALMVRELGGPGAVQVLTPMRKGPLGMDHLNHHLQSLFNPGEGGVRIGILDPVELGRIGNPFEGAATAAGVIYLSSGTTGRPSATRDLGTRGDHRAATAQPRPPAGRLSR